MKRLGILGGTFDPIHCGHLVIAEEARVRLSLDEVRFIPAGQPPHKGDRALTSAGDRLAMVRLATQGNDAFTVSTVEMERGGPSYTVDTLEHIRGTEGEAGERFFIAGADALTDLLSWRAPARILDLCTLVVVRRPDVAPADLDVLTARLPALRNNLILLDGPQFAVSGTEIRERASRGRPFRYQVPESVWSYITEHHLYQSGPDRRDSTV